MKVVEIDERTRIPLSFIIAILAVALPILIGFAGWLTAIYSDLAVAKTSISSLASHVDRLESIDDKLQSIDRRLARIEGRSGTYRPESK